MESAVDHLEESFQKTNSRLDDLTEKLDIYEKLSSTDDSVSNPDDVREMTEMTLVLLLQTINKMVKEYEELRQEIIHVQRIQKEVSLTVKTQLRQVQDTFRSLQAEVISNPGKFRDGLPCNHKSEHSKNHTFKK